MDDDSALLRQFVENHSDEAFAELVRRYVNLVYSTALRETRGDSHRAEETTQLVFIDLARKAPSLVNRTVLGGWLYLSVAFAAARLARADRRWHRREQEANAMYESNAESSARDLDWNRLWPVLDVVMREMEQRDREAVLLRFFEGLSFAQIGERLRFTEDTARKRVERALGKLQSLLERRGIKSTTAALASVLAAEAVTAAPAGLAGAATGAALTAGGGAIGVFAFMSTTKLIVGIVGAAALAGAVGYVLKNRAGLQRTPPLQAAPLRTTEQGLSTRVMTGRACRRRTRS
jgi:RNA polymerase sigma factor (sigma-70 family)